MTATRTSRSTQWLGFVALLCICWAVCVQTARAAPAVVPPRPSYQFQHHESDGFSVYWSWNFVDETISVRFEAPGNGWIGMGLGEGMHGADMWVGWANPTDGTWALADMYSYRAPSAPSWTPVPHADTAYGGKNDLRDTACQRFSEYTACSFTRDANTGDLFDHHLLPTSTAVVYAWRDGVPGQFHSHTVKQTTRFHLFPPLCPCHYDYSFAQPAQGLLFSWRYEQPFGSHANGQLPSDGRSEVIRVRWELPGSGYIGLGIGQNMSHADMWMGWAEPYPPPSPAPPSQQQQEQQPQQQPPQQPQQPHQSHSLSPRTAGDQFFPQFWLGDHWSVRHKEVPKFDSELGGWNNLGDVRCEQVALDSGVSLAEADNTATTPTMRTVCTFTRTLTTNDTHYDHAIKPSWMNWVYASRDGSPGEMKFHDVTYGTFGAHMFPPLDPTFYDYKFSDPTQHVFMEWKLHSEDPIIPREISDDRTGGTSATDGPSDPFNPANYTHIEIRFELPGSDWVGLGIGEDMFDADMMVGNAWPVDVHTGGYTGGGVIAGFNLTDRFSRRDKEVPQTDRAQGGKYSFLRGRCEVVHSGKWDSTGPDGRLQGNDGTQFPPLSTACSFLRQLNTHDDYDIVMTPSVTNFVWAFRGNGTSFGDFKVHDQHGSFAVNLGPPTQYDPAFYDHHYRNAFGGFELDWSFQINGSVSASDPMLTADPTPQEAMIWVRYALTGSIWAGLGFGSLSMADADVIIGWADGHNASRYNVSDRWSLHHGLPPQDNGGTYNASNPKEPHFHGAYSLQKAGAKRINGKTVVVFRRLLDTGDPYDHVIPQGPVNIIYAWRDPHSHGHPDLPGNLGYHFKNYSAVSVDLSPHFTYNVTRPLGDAVVTVAWEFVQDGGAPAIRMRFEIAGKPEDTYAYVFFGWGVAGSQGGVHECDVVSAYVTVDGNGAQRAVVSDRWGTGADTIALDTELGGKDNLESPYAFLSQHEDEHKGAVTVSFTRHLDTGDRFDYALQADSDARAQLGVGDGVPVVFGYQLGTPGDFTPDPAKQHMSSEVLQMHVPEPPSPSDQCTFSSEIGNFFMEWDLDETKGEIKITFRLRGSAYVALGLSDSGMRKADVWIGYVQAGNAVLTDRWVDGHQTPVLDTQLNGGHDDLRDISVKSIQLSGGSGYEVSFTRDLVTGDPWDHAISNGMTSMIYAFKDGAPGDVSQHNSANRFQFVVDLSKCGGQSTGIPEQKPGPESVSALVLCATFLAIWLGVVAVQQSCSRASGFAGAAFWKRSAPADRKARLLNDTDSESLSVGPEHGSYSTNSDVRRRVARASPAIDAPVQSSFKSREPTMRGCACSPVWVAVSAVVTLILCFLYGLLRADIAAWNKQTEYRAYYVLPSPDLVVYYLYLTLVLVAMQLHWARPSHAILRVLHHRVTTLWHYSVGELLMVLGYIALNLWWFLWWFNSHEIKQYQDQPTLRWAFASGHLNELNLALLLLPASRNSVWFYLFGIPFERAIKYHRWMGRVVFTFVAFHMALWWRVWVVEGTWIACAVKFDTDVCSSENVWSGQLAFLLMIVVVGFAYETIRRKKFEWFYYSHHMFILVFIFSIIHSAHALSFRSHFLKYFMFPLALYAFDRVLRIVKGRIHSYQLVSLQVEEAEVTRVVWTRVKDPTSLAEGNGLPFNHWAGQYAFVCFPDISGLQWHPFSISSCPNPDPGSPHAFHIKDMGPQSFTGRLRKMAVRLAQAGVSGATDLSQTAYTDDESLVDVLDVADSSSSPRHVKDVRILIDGPYGYNADCRDYSVVALAAGGVGITPIISMVMDLYHRALLGTPQALGRLEEVHFVWIVKRPECFRWFLPALQMLLSLPEVQADGMVGRTNSLLFGEESRVGSRSHSLSTDVEYATPALGNGEGMHDGSEDRPAVLHMRACGTIRFVIALYCTNSQFHTHRSDRPYGQSQDLAPTSSKSSSYTPPDVDGTIDGTYSDGGSDVKSVNSSGGDTDAEGMPCDSLPQFNVGRPRARDVIRRALHSHISRLGRPEGPVGAFVCGPQPLVDDVLTESARLGGDMDVQVDVHPETFKL